MLKNFVESTSKEIISKSYKDSALSVQERVDDLLSEMTLEEKVMQMQGIWKQTEQYVLNENGKVSLEKLENNFKNGLGQIGRLSSANGGLEAKKMADMTNRIQKFFVEETRLGIPVIFHEECLHGLAAKEATSYPQPIGLAATFNPELVENIYAAIADDTRKRGAHQALTPVLDVAREPRWGRVEETFGEDPFLISQIGIAAVKGFQGDGKFKNKDRVVATLKHFAAHGQPESGSNCGPVNVSERVLRDTFLFPFKEAIKKADALSVMASYNEIDGIPSHANQWLLRKVLRDEWGFKGFVVSDYYAVTELFHKEETLSHAVAGNKTEAAKLAAVAGVNIELPEIDCYPSLVSLVRNGSLETGIIDQLVSEMLRVKFLLGLFDDPYVDVTSLNSDIKMEKDRELAFQAALETITLLKNDNNVLPLNKHKIKKLAVIGPNADARLLGGYSGKPKYYTSVLEGIKNKAGDSCEVLYSLGCHITINGDWDKDQVILPTFEQDVVAIQQAVETANQADLIIITLGGNEQTSREGWSKTHLGDRTSLDLFGRQNDLVKAISETGKPIVALLFNGRPLSVKYLADKIPGIIECWYLGQETGRAVADVLFGDYNPGGKLPISIPRSVGHIPCYYNKKPSARRGYLFEDISPLFSFGFGLSYATFKISAPELIEAQIPVSGQTVVKTKITNTSAIPGHEVVQMYIRDLVSTVTRPVMELKGFKKVFLKPGENKEIQFIISSEQLSFTNINMEYVVEPGEFEIMIGNSSNPDDLKKVILTVR
jgi:beta-glucosidase